MAKKKGASKHKTNNSNKKSKSEKVDKKKCNRYGFCDATKYLEQCSYCHKYFCPTHFQAFKPELGPHSETTDGDRGHPCLQFVDAEQNNQTSIQKSAAKINYDIHSEDSESDDAKSENNEPKKKFNTTTIEKIFKITGIILIVLIILAALILLIASVQQNKSERTATREVTVTQNLPVNLSFERLSKVTDVTYTEKIALTGYLTEEVIQVDAATKVNNKYIIDDNNHKIKLVLGFSQDKKFGSLFITDHITEHTFNVTGEFKYKYSGFVIEVSDIIVTKKPTENRTVTIIENYTIEDNKGISLNFSRGIEKLIG
jgi:Na+-transporting methylmalonyl-CoA/oxaloacetate decarboxylase gamma subunit